MRSAAALLPKVQSCAPNRLKQTVQSDLSVQACTRCALSWGRTGRAPPSCCCITAAAAQPTSARRARRQAIKPPLALADAAAGLHVREKQLIKSHIESYDVVVHRYIAPARLHAWAWIGNTSSTRAHTLDRTTQSSKYISTPCLSTVASPDAMALLSSHGRSDRSGARGRAERASEVNYVLHSSSPRGPIYETKQSIKYLICNSSYYSSQQPR
jgi:hypothetical protein